MVMAKLVWVQEGQVIEDDPLPKRSFRMGRHKDNTIVFTSCEVTSSHAKMKKVGPGYVSSLATSGKQKSAVLNETEALFRL